MGNKAAGASRVCAAFSLAVFLAVDFRINGVAVAGLTIVSRRPSKGFALDSNSSRSTASSDDTKSKQRSDRDTLLRFPSGLLEASRHFGDPSFDGMLAGLRWKPDGLATSMQRFCTKFGSRHVRDICTGTRRLLEHKIKSLGSAAESPLETLKLLRMVPLHPLFLREGPEESPLSSPPDQPDSTPRLLEVEEYLLPIKTADPDNRMGRARLLDLLEYRSCVTDVANSDQFNDISKSGMPNWIQLRFTSLLQPPEADAMATGLLVNAMDLRGAPLETRRQCERAGDRDCDTSEATAPPAGTHLTRTASSFTLVLMARIAAVFDADEHRGRKCGADGSAEESRRPACARLNAFLKFRKAARGAAEEISRLSFSDFDAQVKQICLDYDTTTVSQAETRHMRDLVHGKALITTLAALQLSQRPVLHTVLSIPLISLITRRRLRWLRSLLSESARAAIELEEALTTEDLGLGGQALSDLQHARQAATVYSVLASIHCATAVPDLTKVASVRSIAQAVPSF